MRFKRDDPLAKRLSRRSLTLVPGPYPEVPSRHFRSVKEAKLRFRAQSCCCGDDSAFLGGVQTRGDLCPVKGTCMTESPTRATMFTKGVTMVPCPVTPHTFTSPEARAMPV